MTNFYRRSQWEGRLALVLEGKNQIGTFTWVTIIMEGVGAFKPIGMLADALPTITGSSIYVNAKADGRDRIVRCPVCADLMNRDKLIADGYRTGMDVCPECWDPPDMKKKEPTHFRRGPIT
jgi:hypothetical protein